MKKNLTEKLNQQKKNVSEHCVEGFQHNVTEDSSNSNIEIPRVKNILKMPTPLPLEPSLYSPIHPNRDIVKEK